MVDDDCDHGGSGCVFGLGLQRAFSHLGFFGCFLLAFRSADTAHCFSKVDKEHGCIVTIDRYLSLSVKVSRSNKPVHPFKIEYTYCRPRK